MPPKLLIEGTNSCEDFEWEDLTDTVTDAMNRLTKGRAYPNYWKAEVANFGWRSLSGSKNFKASNGDELLKQVLPNTQCSFKIYVNYTNKVISINNAHHDKPMGGEWYYISPMSVKEAEAHGAY